MKTSRSITPVFQIALVSCLTVGGFAEAQQAPVYPQYAASTYYPPQKPSVMDRIRGAGQNVGDFVRRKFYGEGAPVSYQQPAYQSSGGYRTQRYNLDAPAPAEAPASHPTTTGFQEPTRGTTPKYVTPPRDDEPTEKPQARTESPAPKKTESKPATTASIKPKSSAPVTRSKEKEAEQEKTTASASKKRYTPAKPSTFAKSSAKSTAEKKHVEDEPPAPKPQKRTEPSQVVHYDDASTKEAAADAQMKTETTPPSSTQTASISPTIGGSDVDLTPKSPLSDTTTETKSTVSSESKKTVTEGEAKSGSFMIGKKGSKPGRVVSPYAPYNELDVTGLPSGSLALDPTTQKVFQVP